MPKNPTNEFVGVCQEPYDYQSVHKIFLTLLANGSKDPINDFIDGVEMGKIVVSTFAMGFSKELQKKLYKKHLEITGEFEKKYNL